MDALRQDFPDSQVNPDTGRRQGSPDNTERRVGPRCVGPACRATCPSGLILTQDIVVALIRASALTVEGKRPLMAALFG
jgi:hypothetical protein